MSVLDATERKIALLPKDLQDSVDAELALVLAKQLDGESPTAAQAKELRSLMTTLTAELAAAAPAVEDPIDARKRAREERRAAAAKKPAAKPSARKRAKPASG
jgi:hypothetical protein